MDATSSIRRVYVAMDKGFFDDEGLDVEIKHIKQSTRQSAIDLINNGEADIIMMQFVGALIARGQGVPLVNVLQTSQNCGLVYVSKKPVTSYEQLQNKKLPLGKMVSVRYQSWHF